MKVEGCRFSPSDISRFILHAPTSFPVLKCQVYSKNPSAKHLFPYKIYDQLIKI